MSNLISDTFVVLQQWELLVLDVLDWELSAVTSYNVLDHLLRAQGQDEPTLRKHAETFVALAATEHHFLKYPSGVIAAACLGSAVLGLNPEGLEKCLNDIESRTEIARSDVFKCMSDIEMSIRLSMNGSSFRPVTTENNENKTAKVVIQQKQQVVCGHQSTTPTDVMEITCAY